LHIEILSEIGATKVGFSISSMKDVALNIGTPGYCLRSRFFLQKFPHLKPETIEGET
jgi:hypothetical protein